MRKVNAHGQPQNLDEGFSSDAQRRAAFAQGYKAKGKKDKKDEEVLDEAKATLSRFGGDRLKSSIMNLAKQKGLKVKDLGKDKIEISGNGKMLMALTLAVQKKDVKINEDVNLDEKFSPKQIKMAIGVASDPRYKRGNMTGAIKAIEKIKKGLSDHPQVSAVLQRQNEEVDIQEDGHTDVASAIRQCKTIVEDAMQITSKLQTMNPEDSLPSWWTNKLAVSSNSMNKLRDYFLVPTTEEVELEEKSEYGPDIRGEISQLQKMLKGLERGKKTPGRGFAKMRIKELIAALEKRQAQDDAVMKLRGEEVELEEKAGDIPDLKNLVGELVKASGMHLAQSKRVQAHVDMMTKANAKGPEGAGGLADLKKIVGELQKASEAHKRQSKSIDAHVKFMDKMEMKEYIEDELEEKVYFSKKTKDGNIFQVVDRDTKGMKGSQDKFQMQIVSKGGKMVKDIGSHPSVDGAKQYAKSKGILEEVELDEQFDYVLLDKDNKIVARASGKNAKKEMESSKKSAHLPPMRIPKAEVSKMKVYPINPKDKKGIGDMVIAIGEEVELDEGTRKSPNRKEYNELLKKMKSPIKAKDAVKMIKKYIIDDELQDDLAPLLDQAEEEPVDDMEPEMDLDDEMQYYEDIKSFYTEEKPWCYAFVDGGSPDKLFIVHYNEKTDTYSYTCATDEYGTDYKFFAEKVLPTLDQDQILTHDEFFGGSPFPLPREGSEFVGEVFDENDNNVPEHAAALKAAINENR